MSSYLTLGQLVVKYNSMNLPDSHALRYGIGEPMSWRGSYDEVAFPIVKDITLGECKKHLEMAEINTFMGYKGGEYVFHDMTPVNFEHNHGSWSDGSYATDMIDVIKNYEPEHTIETQLADLITNIDKILY